MSDQDLEIQGKSATTYEANVAMALTNLGFDYIFQFSISGGRRLRGGAVIDFYVITVPLPTPIFCNGDYWHSDPDTELFQETFVNQALAGSANPVVILWGKDCSTYSAAVAAIRRELL